MEIVDLEKAIWNEPQIMVLLGVNRAQLDNLRLKRGLPFVRLGQRLRVYLSDEILDYLKRIAERR